MSRRLPSPLRRQLSSMPRLPFAFQSEAAASDNVAFSSRSAALSIGGGSPPSLSGHPGDVAGAVHAVSAVRTVAGADRFRPGAVAGVALADPDRVGGAADRDAGELRRVVVV